VLPALSAVSRAATPLARAAARGTDDRRRRHWPGRAGARAARVDPRETLRAE